MDTKPRFFPDEGGFPTVRNSIFRIEVTDGDRTASATAFCVAILQDEGRLVLATAKHVVGVPEDKTVWWKVQQFNAQSQMLRQIEFGTNKARLRDVPYRTHKELDIGLLVVPSHDKNKKQFLNDVDQPLPLINRSKGVGTGTRIGWAGFPGVIDTLLGHPQLCYFEGVVSSMVDTDKRRVYIVDGHSAKGVSGGPVWCFDDSSHQLQIAGVVSSYRSQKHELERLPGFCIFEPINALIYYLENWMNQGVRVSLSELP